MDAIQVVLLVIISNVFLFIALGLVIRYFMKNVRKTIDVTGHHIKSNLETVRIIMGKGGD